MREDSSIFLMRWHEGDEDALAALVERHLPWLRRFASQRMGARLRRLQDSGDVVQDVLIRLLRYGPTYVPASEAQFRGLLGRMVRNRLADLCDYQGAQRRARDREAGLEERESLLRDASSARPDRRAEAADEAGLLHVALELLDPGDRRVIVLREWHCLPLEDVGKRLGIATKAAGKRYQRAVVRLGRELDRVRAGRLDDLVADVAPFATEPS